MTSRRAQRRRALVRATVATPPATPGRELERWRPGEVATMAREEGLEGFASLERRVAAELEAERATRLAGDALRARMLAANWMANDPARLGLGLKAWREVARVQVPPDLRRDLVVGAGRPLECYERSLMYAVDHHDHDVILVHGLLIERGRLWPHAWCEIGGTAVYDPALSEFLDLRDFYRVLQPTVVGVYTPEQAATMAITEGNAGPWGAYSRGRPGYVLALEAVVSLSEDYARTFPDLAVWVQRMRERDERFAGELADLMKRDALAVIDLLATLVERPDLWRSHEPGSGPWPYRLRKDPDSARVILPEVT